MTSNDVFQEEKEAEAFGGWEKIKEEMMQFIAISMSLVNRVENLEKTAAYLALKDPEFVAQLKASGVDLPTEGE